MSALAERLRGAWQGRVSGCMLGKAVEALSMASGREALTSYLDAANALPLRDYIPVAADPPPLLLEATCRGRLQASVPDDDINYSVLALELLERHGEALTTEDVARAWLTRLPVGMTFTAERDAYRTLVNRAHDWFPMGAPAGFDVTECADNEHSDWIGAQIRADVYGWVVPGEPARAAHLAATDAALSHRGDGIHGAVLVAAWGAAIPAAPSLEAALEEAAACVPADSGAGEAIRLGRETAAAGRDASTIHARYADLPPVHTNNNLALVVWALLSYPDDFGAAIGEVVAAGWDTDCNGATVGALWALQGRPVPDAWTAPWRGRVGVTLAGCGELALDELVARTVDVVEALSAGPGSGIQQAPRARPRDGD